MLAGPRAHAGGGGGGALLGAAKHDGILVEVPRPLHRHCHRAVLLTHIVARKEKEAEKSIL